MQLQPTKGLKTSCTLACIGLRREGNSGENHLIFGQKIGFANFYTSSGGGTGTVDQVSQYWRRDWKIQHGFRRWYWDSGSGILTLESRW